MQWNEQSVVRRELVEAVEVLRVRHLVIMQRAQRALDHIVEPEIGARGEIRRQDAVVPPGHEDRGNLMQVA